MAIKAIPIAMVHLVDGYIRYACLVAILSSLIFGHLNFKQNKGNTKIRITLHDQIHCGKYEKLYL